MALYWKRFKSWDSNPFFKTIFVTRVYFEPHANVKKLRSEIISHLKINNKVKVVESNEKDCDVKVVFCPIVSRAGTDIEAALSRLTHEKPTIMIVLHHTFDPEHIAPSSSSWDIKNVMMVDVLFHENSGLLNPSKNKKAIESAKNYLQKFSKPHRVVRKRICAGLIVTAGVMFIYRFFPWDAFPHDPIWHILESTDSDEF